MQLILFNIGDVSKFLSSTLTDAEDGWQVKKVTVGPDTHAFLEETWTGDLIHRDIWTAIEELLDNPDLAGVFFITHVH